MDTGFFNQKARTITTNIPKKEMTCLVNPLLKPTTAPDKIKSNMIASTMFIASIPSSFIILQK